MLNLVATEVFEPGRSPLSGAIGTDRPAYFVLLRGGTTGTLYRLDPGVHRLGRAIENEIQVLEASLSRFHAKVVILDDGQAFLTDLGSTNGTYLNGRPLAEHSSERLHDGDRIRFGAELVLKFARPDPFEERFQREMFERAVRDPLTGMDNRAYFLDQLELLATRAAHRNQGLAVMLIDVDHFKRINDTHGHAVGDAVLRQIAEILRQQTRPGDLSARYGGEEFVIALPIDRFDQAMTRAEQVRLALGRHPILVEAIPLRVTVSIGVCFAPPEPLKSSEGLLAEADRCLYQAKAQGRDRVVLGRLDAPPTVA